MATPAGKDQDLLAMALVGYEAQKGKIDAAIRGIQAQLGHRRPGRPSVAADGAAPAKRTMNPAARRRIAASQRKRWAALKKSQSQTRALLPQRSASSALLAAERSSRLPANGGRLCEGRLGRRPSQWRRLRCRRLRRQLRRHLGCILFRYLRVTLRFLFRRLRDGEGLNRHYNSLIIGSYYLQQFGPVALGIGVVYKRRECYESASFGVSLYHPMEDH